MNLGMARDWLVKQGKAKPGRGKFSNEAKVLLTSEVTKGNTFSDWPKSAITVPAPVSGDAQTDTVKVIPAVSEFVEAAEPRYPTNLQAYAIINGKEVQTSITEVCKRCGYSLRWCYCENSVAMVAVPGMSTSLPVFLRIPGMA